MCLSLKLCVCVRVHVYECMCACTYVCAGLGGRSVTSAGKSEAVFLASLNRLLITWGPQGSGPPLARSGHDYAEWIILLFLPLGSH